MASENTLKLRAIKPKKQWHKLKTITDGKAKMLNPALEFRPELSGKYVCMHDGSLRRISQ